MVDTFTMGFGPDVFGSVRKHLQVAMRELAKKIEDETGVVSANVDAHIREALDETVTPITGQKMFLNSMPDHYGE